MLRIAGGAVSLVVLFRCAGLGAWGTDLHGFFLLISVVSFVLAFRSYSPCDLSARKPRFHENPLEGADFLMVASPTRAYVEKVFSSVEVYDKFQYWFQFCERFEK